MPRARSATVCLRCADRALGRGEERRAVVVQVLADPSGPRRRSRTSAGRRARARCGRPSIDGADARALAAHEADGAGGAGAHGDALQARCPRGRPRRSRDRARRRRSRSPAVPLRGRSGSTNPSSRARRTPISHSASSSSSCALACTRGPEARPMRERAEATASSARWCCLRRALVLALGHGVGHRGQLSVTRRPRAIRSSRPSEMSLTVCVARRRPPRMRISVNTSTAAPTAASSPHPGPLPPPGAAAAEDGRAAAATAAAPSALARAARVRGSAWVRPSGVVTVLASAPRRGAPVLRVRDLTRSARSIGAPVLDNETLMF